MGIDDLPRKLEERLASVLSTRDFGDFCDNCGLPGDVEFRTIADVQVELCEDCYQTIQDLLDT